MADEKVETTTIPAGTVPEPINNAWDCPTFLVDGLLGMAISSHQVRIGLVEHVPAPDKIVAKFVANLVMPVDQFAKFVASLNAITDQVNSSEQAEK